jgi:signal transduction histidine kinase
MAVDGAGEITANRSLTELIGVDDGISPASLSERFEISRLDGQALREEELPWRRSARGETFTDDEVWYDRRTAQRLFLHLRSHANAGDKGGLIAFENAADQALAMRLADLIVSVGTSLVRVDEPSALAHAVLEDLAAVAGADAVFLLAAEQGGQRLRMLASLGAPPGLRDEPDAKLIDSIMVRAARTGEPQEVDRIEDLPEKGFEGTRQLLHLGIQSVFAFPLIASGELVGVLEVARRQHGKLSAFERRILRGAAAGCAVGLRQSQLRAAERRETERLRTLREAALTIGAALPLRELLQRLVAQACDLTRARYGAVGILREQGEGLSDFVFAGVPDDVARRIGHLPAGHGLLGAILRSAEPIRVADIRSDPRFEGFPPEHPTMTSFLGLPLLLEKQIFGNLYVADKDGGVEFTEEDERVLQLLAAQSSLAIAYAKQLKVADRLRDEFAAVVAHDLRNPVSAILFQIESLQQRAEGDRVTVPVAALERLRRSGYRVSQLAGDLLDASRIELKQVSLARAPLCLGHAASALLNEIATTLGDHPISVEVQGEPPLVSADPSRIDQILTNLLDNAAKYSAPGSPIRVLIAPAPGGATIAVEDRGVGIAAEDMPKLFDRFYQAPRSRARKTGLGLGLYITKGLVEAHGGKMEVESTLGQGSRFCIWLPQAEPLAAEAPATLH